MYKIKVVKCNIGNNYITQNLEYFGVIELHWLYLNNKNKTKANLIKIYNIQVIM